MPLLLEHAIVHLGITVLSTTTTAFLLLTIALNAYVNYSHSVGEVLHLIVVLQISRTICVDVVGVRRCLWHVSHLLIPADRSSEHAQLSLILKLGDVIFRILVLDGSVLRMARRYEYLHQHHTIQMYVVRNADHFGSGRLFPKIVRKEANIIRDGFFAVMYTSSSNRSFTSQRIRLRHL